MADVLSAEEHAVREILKENSRLNQSGHRLKPESADCVHLLIHFAQLRNANRIEIQSRQTFAVLGARMRPMRRLQRAPDCRPNLMLFFGVRSIGNRIAGVIHDGNLRDLIAAPACRSIRRFAT